MGKSVAIGEGNVSIAGTISYEDSATLSPPQIVVNQNDYFPDGLHESAILRLDSSGVVNITGLKAPDKAQQITLFNVGSSGIRLKINDANSLAENRFLIGGDILLQQNESVILIYDIVDNRWRTSAEHT